MFNKVILIGRLTRDPELRYTPSGLSVASFGLAVERQSSNQQDKRGVDFIDIVVWQKQAENCAKHMGKGRLVAVEGRLQVSSYQDKEGQRRRRGEVVADLVRFLDWPNSVQDRVNSAMGAPTESGEGNSDVNLTNRYTDDKCNICRYRKTCFKRYHDKSHCNEYEEGAAIMSDISQYDSRY